MTYVLILYVYAGMLAKGDSVTMQAVYGFKSQAECVAAGKAADPLVQGSTKVLRYVCVQQTR